MQSAGNRRFSLTLAALATLAALPAAAQEGGAIRTGEHAGFTRVVMVIEPTTEWSLETGPGEAVLFFPGKRLDFATAGVFDRIPRTRVTAIDTGPAGTGTRVVVGLGCDCRISASFVGARYLALDVSDRDAPRVAAESVPVPGETPEERALREVAAVASAEEALLAQIARAADQGVVRLTVAGPPPAPPGPAPRPEPTATRAPQPDPAGEPTAATEAEGLAALLAGDQIEATSVYDRDRAAVLGLRPEPPVSPVCLPADLFAVADWSDGSPLHAQTPALMARVVGEFDRPDPAALRDLARLYIRFGFGAEAEALLADFDAEVDEQALLRDLARTVEGRAVAPGGPLAVAAACPGPHALWLALGGAAPAYRDAGQFAAVQAAFAELPPDLRRLLGPALTGRLLDAGRAAEARLIFATAIRAGGPRTVELDLAAARLDAAEGRSDAALAGLRALAESNAPNAADALIALTRIALDAGVAVPLRLVTDLRAAALTRRGDPSEAAIRGLLVEALAARDALPAALAEVRAARADLPGAADAFAALGVAALAAADPAAVGRGAYAETALAAADLIPRGPAGDPSRRAVAARLSNGGLPNAAIGLLAPALVRGDAAAARLAARAYLALGEPEAALAVLDVQDGAEALGLRAAALARSGAPRAAAALLAAAGAEAEALPYAWTSGDWTRARAAAEADPARAAMAGFMAAQAGAAPATPPGDPAALSPEAAFEAPLPALGAPSLGASRALLANGRQIGGFVGALLDQD